MRKLSAIVFASTILIFGNVYGQGQEAVRRVVPSASSSSAQVSSTDVKDSSIESAVKSDVDKKSDVDRGSAYIPYKGFCRHELLTWGGIGFSSLRYSAVTFGDRNARLGGILGGGYGLHFNPHWSMGIGLEFALYNMRMNIDGLQDGYNTPDGDDDPITYYSEVNRYTEKQRLYTFNIPLWLQYQTPIVDSRHEFYAALGFKLGIPLSAKYRSRDADLTTYGYYPEWVVTLYDQNDLGYGDWDGRKEKKRLDLNPLVYMVSAETGVIWDINHPRINLYTGVYFDFGLNDIMKKSGTKFLEYNSHNPENFRTNSVLTSEYTRFGETNDFMSRVSTIALGLKVRVGFNMCRNRQTERPKVYDTRDKEDRKRDEELRVDVRQIIRQPVQPAVDTAVPYYTATPLLEAEMRRASAEYGKLTDVVVLYVDGYEINQSHLSPIMQGMLDDKIRLLQRYNSDRYIIIAEGHTCDLGRPDFNLRLGQMRAEVVREYLMSKGFNGENIIATSKGLTAPIVPNTSEANRKINRRVVFLIKEKR